MAGAEKRVQGIDLLRGLCIVAVILNHINLRIPFHSSRLGEMIGPAANNVLCWSGHNGVRVFFVISGFLIAGWSLKRWEYLGNIRLRQFYAMRFARIVPCLIALLSLLTVLDLARVPKFTIVTHVSLGRALLAALTFHVNLLEIHTWYLPAAWDVLWSLSVEEVFYIFFPLLCVLIRKQFLLIALLSGFIIAGPFARVFAPNAISADYGYLCCMDGIAFGCLAAMVSGKIKFSERAGIGLFVSGTSLSLLVEVFRHTAYRIGLFKVGLDETVLEIGVALLLIGLQQRFERRLAEKRAFPTSSGGTQAKAFLRDAAGFPFHVLRWFGRNSYEVYLTHMLVVWPMVIAFQGLHQSLNMAPLWFLATLAFAGAVGHLVSRFYSEPLNRTLRARLVPVVGRVETPAPSTAMMNSRSEVE